MTDEIRLYDRLMLRSAFQSLFAVIMLARKQRPRLTTSAPNWQIDKLSDTASALGVDLIVEARDRTTGLIYTPSGTRAPEDQQP